MSPCGSSMGNILNLHSCLGWFLLFKYIHTSSVAFSTDQISRLYYNYHFYHLMVWTSNTKVDRIKRRRILNVVMLSTLVRSNWGVPISSVFLRLILISVISIASWISKTHVKNNNWELLSRQQCIFFQFLRQLYIEQLHLIQINLLWIVY